MGKAKGTHTGSSAEVEKGGIERVEIKEQGKGNGGEGTRGKGREEMEWRRDKRERKGRKMGRSRKAAQCELEFRPWQHSVPPPPPQHHSVSLTEPHRTPAPLFPAILCPPGHDVMISKALLNHTANLKATTCPWWALVPPNCRFGGGFGVGLGAPALPHPIQHSTV